MNFDVIHDNLLYFLVGAYPHGPLGGAALTLLLSVLSASLSAVLGLAFGIALVMPRRCLGRLFGPNWNWL